MCWCKRIWMPALNSGSYIELVISLNIIICMYAFTSIFLPTTVEPYFLIKFSYQWLLRHLNDLLSSWQPFLFYSVYGNVKAFVWLESSAVVIWGFICQQFCQLKSFPYRLFFINFFLSILKFFNVNLMRRSLI